MTASRLGPLRRGASLAVVLLALGSAGLVACASETTPDEGTGGADAGARTGNGGASSGGTDASTCADIADVICERAESCAGDGSAKVKINDATSYVYESLAFCTGVFTDQCGPSVPESFSPRVPDPAACGAALVSTACDEDAYPIPDACGGS